jgi:hypothetical protein
MDIIARKLGVQTVEQWLNVSRREVEHLAREVVKHYAGSVTTGKDTYLVTSNA